MISLQQALLQNGFILERARRSGRSLLEKERNIVVAVRSLAAEKFSSLFIDSIEMEGERDRTVVLQPMRVTLKFAFYNSGEYPNNPQPEYHIVSTNHSVFPLNGNIDAADAQKYGIKVPKTPTFEEWVKKGRPCYRGEKSLLQQIVSFFKSQIGDSR